MAVHFDGSQADEWVDKDLIRDLASLLKETELSEIEIEQDGLKVRVRKASAHQQVVMVPASVPGPARSSRPKKEPSFSASAVAAASAPACTRLTRLLQPSAARCTSVTAFPSPTPT